MKIKASIEFKDGRFWVHISPKLHFRGPRIADIRSLFKKSTGDDLVLPTYTDIINDPQSTFPVRCVKNYGYDLRSGGSIAHYKGDVKRRCDIIHFMPAFWKRCLTAPKENFKTIEGSKGKILIPKK